MKNSGEFNYNRVASYIMPGLLAVSAVLVACSPESSQPVDANTPAIATTTTKNGQDVYVDPTFPEITISPTSIESTSTTIAMPLDSCSEDNPVLGDFSESNKAVTQSLNTLYDQYFDNQTGTEEEALAAVQFLTETYGFNLTLPHESRLGSGFDYGAVTEDLTIFLNDRMRDLAEALSHFSPELIKSIGLKEMAFVKSITRTPGYDDGGSVIDVAAGVYLSDSNTIYVDIGSLWDIQDVIVHEIVHAIDSKVFCGDDMFIDEALTKYNTVPYTGYGEELNNVDPELTQPGPDRVYFRTYGAANAAEDRATILEETIMRRGLILEGDPDWGSPLQLKQAELVRRIDEVTPGFGNFMLERTIGLRSMSTNELNDFIPNPFQEGELSSAANIIEYASQNNLPVEQLRGAALTIYLHGNEDTMVVENPIVIRDDKGDVRAVVWANNYSLSASFYDKYRMTFRAVDEASVLDTSGSLSVVQDQNNGTFFNPKEIFVDGVASQELIINGNYPSPSYIDNKWPNVIDPSAISQS